MSPAILTPLELGEIKSKARSFLYRDHPTIHKLLAHIMALEIELRKLRESKLPEIPQLEGKIPIVLYFSSHAEADDFVRMVAEACPNLVSKQL